MFPPLDQSHDKSKSKSKETLQRIKKGEIVVIIFDLDGTLYPKLPELDKAIQTKICEIVAQKLEVELIKILIWWETLYEGSGSTTVMEIFRTFDRTLSRDEAKEIVREAINNVDRRSYLKINPYVVKLLNELEEQQYAICLATSSSKKAALETLETIGIDANTFNMCLFDDSPKHDGTAFKKIMMEYPHLHPDEILMVGDSLDSDIIPGQQAGINTLMIGDKPDFDTLQCKDLKTFGGYFKITIEIEA